MAWYKLRIQAAKLLQQNSEHHEKLAHEMSREADQRAFRDVRANAIESKEAATLQ